MVWDENGSESSLKWAELGGKEVAEEVGEYALGSGWGQRKVGWAELGAKEVAEDMGNTCLA